MAPTVWNSLRTEEHRCSIAAPRKIELAATLVTAMSEPFAPAEYQDAYREQLRALIASKEATAAPSKPEQPKQEAADILEALKQSLAQAAKKPPQKVTETPRKARRKA